ncbi:hypothetical protein, partial [Rhodopseudomonas sp. WA056]|uniref:hypothetical protein n=1 Tax=Rhodopseudomonas sp. WA056 TaxID=2269367 RepID=UPI001966D499
MQMLASNGNSNYEQIYDEALPHVDCCFAAHSLDVGSSGEALEYLELVRHTAFVARGFDHGELP